jgi:hypothetical protein
MEGGHLVAWAVIAPLFDNQSQKKLPPPFGHGSKSLTQSGGEGFGAPVIHCAGGEVQALRNFGWAPWLVAAMNLISDHTPVGVLFTLSFSPASRR